MILVTGGAGFIGSHLVKALVKQGRKVRVLDALIEQVHNGVTPQIPDGVELVRGDVRDRQLLDAVLENVEVVYHQAAEVGVGQSMYEMHRYVGGNTFATSVLLEALVERIPRIRKLIVASSMSIYGEGAYQSAEGELVFPRLREVTQLEARQWELVSPRDGGLLKPTGTNEEKPLFPTSVYAITKQDQEQLCLVVGRAYNIPTVALRYFNAYGPGQALSNPYTGACAIFSSRLLNQQAPVIFEDGEQTRDFVHVSDIVQANLLALETDRADYLPVNVGTGRPLPIKRVAEILADELGLKIQPEIVGKYREGDIRHCVADITRAQTLLGYQPKVAVENGLSDLIGWVRNQAASDNVMHATAELASRQLVK